MIARYLTGGLFLALLAVAGWGAWERGARQDAEAEAAHYAGELRVAREVAEQARLAREVEAAHRAREAARAAEKQRALEALLTEDFANADTPVDPRITEYLDCLRRADGQAPDRCADYLGGPADAGAGPR